MTLGAPMLGRGDSGTDNVYSETETGRDLGRLYVYTHCHTDTVLSIMSWVKVSLYCGKTWRRRSQWTVCYSSIKLMKIN